MTQPILNSPHHAMHHPTVNHKQREQQEQGWEQTYQ